MKRGMAALVGAGLILATLPGPVSAAKVTRYTDQFVSVSCESAVDGGYITAFAEHSNQFGGRAELQVWLDPAVPFEDPQSALGFTDTDIHHAAAGATVTVTASWDVGDFSGNPLGTGSMTANMVRVGDPRTEAPFPSVNHHSATTIIDQDLEGTARLDLPSGSYEVPCSGSVSDQTVHDANPTSFVFENAGVQIDCIWISDDSFAEFYVVDDLFGFTTFAFSATADGEVDAVSSTGSIDASGVDVAFDMVDFATGETSTATGSATFALLGEPVTSFLRQQNRFGKAVEQALTPTGSFDLSTGQSYVMDREHCVTETFANHFVSTAPKGPKPGVAPSNDTPDGAIPFKLGSRLNTQTTSAALEPEVEDTSLCPEGFSDQFGHTVWYTFVGTGNPVTMDTSGSGFDTLVKAFTRDGDQFTAVGCNDDVAFRPIGTSFQAVLTIDTQPGVTYYVEAGGFRRFFQPEVAESGRLRLAIH